MAVAIARNGVVHWPVSPIDRVVFREMWTEYLKDLQALGGEQLPTERTLDFYLGLFDRYTEDPSQGAAYFAGDPCVGVILWGDAGDMPWDHTLGRVAYGWGTYVRPPARGMHLSKVLRDVAASHLTHVGFDSVLGSATPDNRPGIESGNAYGFERLHDTRVLRL